MNKRHILTTWALAMLLSLGFTSCIDDDTTMPKQAQEVCLP